MADTPGTGADIPVETGPDDCGRPGTRLIGALLAHASVAAGEYYLA